MADIRIQARAKLTDGRILWGLRAQRYAGSASRPFWIVAVESVHGDERRLQAVDGAAKPAGRSVPFTPEGDADLTSAVWSDKEIHRITDETRVRAVLELCRTQRAGTRDWLHERFRRVCAEDAEAERRRVALSRAWSVVDRRGLAGGGFAALLTLDPERGEGGRHQAVVRIAGNRAEALEASRPWGGGELALSSRALADAADSLARGLDGDAQALTLGMAALDDDGFLLSPSRATATWDFLCRNDEQARLKAEGRLASLSDARRAADAQPLPLRLAKRRERDGIVGVTLMLPAEREAEFRALAEGACRDHRERLKRETERPAVIPLGPQPPPDPADPLAVARLREAVVAPLASLPRLGRAAVAEAAGRVGVSVQRMYGLIAAYRARPETATLMPSKGGRPSGLKVIDETVERIVAEYCRSALAAPEPPSMRALVRSIRERCVADGLKPPDKDTVRKRMAQHSGQRLLGIEEQRRLLEGERVVVHAEAVSALARGWRFGWSRGVGGDTLDFAGTRLEVRKDLDLGGFLPVIGGKPGYRHIKAEDAKRHALTTAMRDQALSAAGGVPERGPWVATPALLDGWADALCKAGRSRWGAAGRRSCFMHLGDRSLVLDGGDDGGEGWLVEVSGLGAAGGQETVLTAVRPSKEAAVRDGMRLALVGFFQSDARRRAGRRAEEEARSGEAE